MFFDNLNVPIPLISPQHFSNHCRQKKQNPSYERNIFEIVTLFTNKTIISLCCAIKMYATQNGSP